MKNSAVNYISWVLQLLIALIYLQTLYFKFSAHPDSVYIFSTLGLEPYGRIGIGVFELITSILILLPQTRIYGGILSVGVISGAILAHLGPLGVVVHDDGGKVFYLALTVFVASIVFLWLNRNDVLHIYRQFKQKTSSK